jgi:hypothetical protein
MNKSVQPYKRSVGPAQTIIPITIYKKLHLNATWYLGKKAIPVFYSNVEMRYLIVDFGYICFRKNK